MYTCRRGRARGLPVALPHEAHVPEPVPPRGLDAGDVAVPEVGQPGRTHRVGRRRPPRLPEHPVEVLALCRSLIGR